MSQLATQGDTLSAVRFLMGCLAWRRSWRCFRPISFERRVQKADDAISLAYLPSRAVGVDAPHLFCGSSAHWRPLASQMLACSQLKSFRLPYAVLMIIPIYRLSAWAHPGPCGQALCVCTHHALWYFCLSASVALGWCRVFEQCGMKIFIACREVFWLPSFSTAEESRCALIGIRPSVLDRTSSIAAFWC